VTTREFFVPDLCRVRAVFMLLITSELLVLVLAIVQAEAGWIDWNYFGLLSLFVQWTTLTSAALICLLRRRLARLSVPRATLCIVTLVLLDVLAFSLFADSVLHARVGVAMWQGIAKKTPAGIADHPDGSAVFLPATPVAAATGS
jgi:two-component system sensor histidine kinase AlgZ